MASTVVLPWPPVLPAGSVAVALTTVPSASGVDGGEAPVAAAVGSDLPDGIAAAIGQGHRGAGSAVPLISRAVASD